MKKKFKQAGLFITGIMAGILFLEVYFQMIEFQLPYFELNEKEGKKMLPSKRITYFGEGFYLGGTNEYGYLGTAYSPKKDPNKIRVAMIGDSYVEGLQVFDNHHFLRLAEKKLNEGLPEPKYEILNFGVGNYDYNNMIVEYVNSVKKFNPDIVVFLLKNDDFIFADSFVPSPVLKINKDSLSIDYSFTQSKVYKTYKKLSWLFENSAVVYATNNAYKTSKRSDELEVILFDKFYTSFRKPLPDPAPLDAKQIVDDRVLKSLSWLNDRPCIFVFRSDIPDAIATKANEMNIKVVNVDQALKQNFTTRGIDYAYWDVTGLTGHWNFEAQDFVGDYMYKLIQSEEDKKQQAFK